METPQLKRFKSLNDLQHLQDQESSQDRDRQESTEDQPDRASTNHQHQDQVKEKIQTQPPKMEQETKRRDSGTKSEKMFDLGMDIADGL